MQIRILVVDDEKETGDYLQLLLTKAGYEVVALTDPTQVMDRLRAEDFHLVILDMMMPQMSGTELLEKIRGYDSDIAVIVATAHPAVETAVASLKAQASDYVKKPVEPEELLAAVEGALAKKGLSKDPEAELHRAIGRTIREARKSQELTLKQLARRTGLSVLLLSQIESEAWRRGKDRRRTWRIQAPSRSTTSFPSGPFPSGRCCSRRWSSGPA